MDIISRINWVDILVVIIVLRISYVSFQSGLSHEIFPLIASILTLIIGLRYYSGLGAFASHGFMKLPATVADCLSFIVLIVALVFIFKVLRALLEIILKTEWHPMIERWGGFLVGIAKATVIAAIVLTILALAPFSYLQKSIRERSLTGMYILQIGPFLYNKVYRLLPGFGQAGFESKKISVEELTADKKI